MKKKIICIFLLCVAIVVNLLVIVSIRSLDSNEQVEVEKKTVNKVEEKEKKEDEEKSSPIETTKIDQSGLPYENPTTVTDLNDITMLVNKYSGLPSDYIPQDLVEVTSSGEHASVLMRQEAAQAFESLIVESLYQGFVLNACSAYRSYEYQQELYNNGVLNYGQEYADQYWTRPGFSEHQTGLSVDIRMDNDLSDLDAVRYNAHYPWLLENMHEFGFILRYPDDKEDKTKIAPESWHLRYVGVDLATYLYENNLSLDEYYGA